MARQKRHLVVDSASFDMPTGFAFGPSGCGCGPPQNENANLELMTLAGEQGSQQPHAYGVQVETCDRAENLGLESGGLVSGVVNVDLVSVGLVNGAAEIFCEHPT